MDYKEKLEVKQATIQGAIRQQKEENENIRVNIDTLNQRLNEGLRNLTAMIGAQQVLKELLEEKPQREKPTDKK